MMSSLYLQDETTDIYRQRAAIAGNVERIKSYDALLTDSARLAAATEDPAYERRYLQIAPELDRLLVTTVELVDTDEARKGLAQTEASNRALVRIEAQSFELTRRGRNAEALALLAGDRYSREKSQYALTSAEAYRSFLASSDARTRSVNERRTVALLIALLGVVVLLVVGVFQVRLRRVHDRMRIDN